MSVREFNLIACPLVQSSWKDLDLNPGRRESSGRQATRHCVLFSGLAHWATKTEIAQKFQYCISIFLTVHTNTTLFTKSEDQTRETGQQRGQTATHRCLNTDSADICEINQCLCTMSRCQLSSPMCHTLMNLIKPNKNHTENQLWSLSSVNQTALPHEFWLTCITELSFGCKLSRLSLFTWTLLIIWFFRPAASFSFNDSLQHSKIHLQQTMTVTVYYKKCSTNSNTLLYAN